MNETKEHIILTIIKNRNYTIRIIMVIAGLLFSILVLVYGFSVIFKWTFPSASVQTNNEGAYSIKFGDKETIHWLFNTSDLWASSGIDVKKGEKLRIFASGKYNTSIHHLNRAGDTDKGLIFPWIGPKGFVDKDRENFRNSDKIRMEDRIVQEANFGALIMQVVPLGKKLTNRPNQVYIIGNENPCVHILETGRLYFAVNEIPLDENRKETYMIRENEDINYIAYRDTTQQSNAWIDIVRDEFWDIWYVDNIGSFLITIEK